MKTLLHSRSLYIALALTAIVGVIIMVVSINNSEQQELVTTTVERGTVRQLVSVSGVAETAQTAELSLPVTGIARSVLVNEGDAIAAGDVLVTLDTAALLADRQEAIASIATAVANRDELIAGPTQSSQTVTAETVAQAESALRTAQDTEARKVTNTYRTLLSSNLAAYSLDPNEDAMPPVITGTYRCDSEGSYIIETFSSSAASGYSYRISGLESETDSASVDQPAPLGTCGLEIQFDEASRYNRTEWVVEIPNTRSATYVTNRNAYSLAVTQAESAIALAEQAVTLAKANAENSNAPARDEVITRANAAITQARARLARIDSQIADRTLTAPFDGTITTVAVVTGETVTTAPIITLLGDSEFEITARIPEIDIGKLEVGQEVEMTFDAKSDEVLSGTIEVISLKATEIDGVAYYEALIVPNTRPNWLRSGLNADIDITITEINDTLRIPKRFITETEEGVVVLRKTGEVVTETPVTVTLEGNDGYSAITGINEGETLVAP